MNKAAQDLGFSQTSVINAFEKVGVNAKCTTPQPPEDEEVILANGQLVTNIQVSKNTEHKYRLSVPALPWYPYSYRYLVARLFDSQQRSAKIYVGYSPNQMKQVSLMKDTSFVLNYPTEGDYHFLVKGLRTGMVSFQAYYTN